MSAYIDDDRIIYEETIEEDNKKDVLVNISSRINKGGEPPTATMEQEKRIRREIANSNERRRMQSINNGFQSLRSLLPHHEGEKLSKAAILQQTAEYIYSLEQEKTRLLSQNCQLKRLVSQHESNSGSGNIGELPPKKRLKTELILPCNPLTATESSDEGLGSMSPEPVSIISVSAVSKTESGELRRQLERERNLRLVLEEQVRQFETQLYHQPQPTAQIYQVESEELSLQLVTDDNLPPVAHTQTVMCSPQHSRTPSPEPAAAQEERLPSVLEAAIKAEPKVEVERLPTTTTAVTTTPAAVPPAAQSSEESRLYVSNTSRQNLETIVEAIRHLEGDHLFGDEEPAAVPSSGGNVVVTQEVPLALTNKNSSHNQARAVAAVQFSAAVVQQSQQSRPGVIVVKQAS